MRGGGPKIVCNPIYTHISQCGLTIRIMQSVAALPGNFGTYRDVTSKKNHTTLPKGMNTNILRHVTALRLAVQVNGRERHLRW